MQEPARPSRPGPRFLGPHAALGAGMVRAVDRARAVNATAIQVFADNPTAWRRRAEPPAEAPAFRERLRHHGLGPVAVHAAYLVNLAGPDPELFDRSVEVLAADLRAAWVFAAQRVNVHTGSHRDTSVAAGILRVAEGIARVLDLAGNDAPETQVVLENSAGGGWAVGVSLEELAMLTEAIDARGIPRERVGFCLDTAHLWGAGYRISDPDTVGTLLDEFDARIGLGRLSMIHLNDSRAECGSRQDRHEHLAAGRIGAAGLARLLQEPRLATVPFYLETPGMDQGYDALNMARALALAAGDPLEPLPDGALQAKARRAGAADPAEPT